MNKAIPLLSLHLALQLIMGLVLYRWYSAFMVCFQLSLIVLYWAIKLLVNERTKIIAEGFILASLLEIPDCIFEVNQYIPSEPNTRKLIMDTTIIIICGLITYYRWNKYPKKLNQP